jgi:hypothetical protein
VDFVPLIGDIYGGSLNEGEDEILGREDLVRTAVSELILEIEFEEKRTLGPEKRLEVDELFRAAIGAPMLAEHDDGEP